MWDFFAAHFWQIFAWVASLGVVGAVVAIAFFGIPAAVALASISRAFNALLKFLSTPFGQAVAIIVAILLAAWVGYTWRASGEAERWADRVAAETEKQDKREAQIRAEVAADAATRLGRLEAEETELSKKEVENERTLPASDSCIPTDDDFKRLRDMGLE